MAETVWFPDEASALATGVDPAKVQHSGVVYGVDPDDIPAEAPAEEDQAPEAPVPEPTDG